MNMSIRVASKMYDTSKATSICSTASGECNLQLPFPSTQYYVLETSKSEVVRFSPNLSKIFRLTNRIHDLSVYLTVGLASPQGLEHPAFFHSSIDGVLHSHRWVMLWYSTKKSSVKFPSCNERWLLQVYWSSLSQWYWNKLEHAIQSRWWCKSLWRQRRRRRRRSRCCRGRRWLAATDRLKRRRRNQWRVAPVKICMTGRFAWSATTRGGIASSRPAAIVLLATPVRRGNCDDPEEQIVHY